MSNPKFDCPCSSGYSFAEALGHPPVEKRVEPVEIYHAQMQIEERPLSPGNVTDAIGEDYLKWNNRCPILIDAPTGSGKTTFVCNKLIPQLYIKIPLPVANAERTLLLISNRAALVQQQKLKVIAAVNNYASTPVFVDTVRIDEYKIFDRVCVCTYQGFFSMLRTAERDMELQQFLSHLKYAVFDEAHFFYSDATYNDQCGRLLSLLSMRLNNVVRIYMTATSWSIRNSLLKAEQDFPITLMYQPLFKFPIGDISYWENSNLPLKRTFYHYKMDGSHDAYNLHFFPDRTTANWDKDEEDDSKEDSSEDGSKKKRSKKVNPMDELLKVLPTPTTDNKLLVFVKSKDDGKYLEKQFLNKNIDAIFIDRESKTLVAEYTDVSLNRSSKRARVPYLIKPYEEGDSVLLLSYQLQPPEHYFNPEEIVKIKAWNLLVSKEKFTQAVLISTSVLDCGINIHDPAVKTIAIFADDPTSFMQMLGRKRLDTGDRIDLWVYEPSLQDFSTKVQTKTKEIAMGDDLSLIQHYITQYSLDDTYFPIYFAPRPHGIVTPKYISRVYNRVTSLRGEALNYAYQARHPDSDYRSVYYKVWRNADKISDRALFYFDSFGCLGVNEYALWVIKEQAAYYSRFTDKENPASFRTEVYRWLGQYDSLVKDQKSAKCQLVDYLESHIDTPIEKDDRDELRKLVHCASYLCLAKSPLPRKWENAAPKTLSSTLKALSLEYTIQTKPKSRKGEWLILRGWTKIAKA